MTAHDRSVRDNTATTAPRTEVPNPDQPASEPTSAWTILLRVGIFMLAIPGLLILLVKLLT